MKSNLPGISLMADKKQPIKLNDALEIIRRQDTFGRFLPFQIAFYTSSKGIQKFKRIVVRHVLNRLNSWTRL